MVLDLSMCLVPAGIVIIKCKVVYNSSLTSINVLHNIVKVHSNDCTDLSVHFSEESLKGLSDVFSCFSTHLVEVSDVMMVSKL